MPSRGFYRLVLGLVPIALSACVETEAATAQPTLAVPAIGVDLGNSARIPQIAGLTGEGEGYGRTEPGTTPAHGSMVGMSHETGMQMDHGPMSGMSRSSMGGMQMAHGSMPGMAHGSTGGMQIGHYAMPRMSRSSTGRMKMAHSGHAHAQGTGTVNSVDTAEHKVNVTHGPIPAIGFPAMTMDFAVAPSVDLQAVKPGTRVNGREGSSRNVCDPVGHARGRGAPMSRNDRTSEGRINRRRFVQGVAASGALATAWPLSRAIAAPQGPVLSGTEFQLEIGPLSVNITGRARTATAINGQIPAPILRWREGDTITLAVTNRLSDPTSIHWHGIRTPSPMDGVPGLSFAGVPPGQTFIYRFPVHQSGTYWYHSHSAFQEQTGMYGPIIIEPKGGYAHPFDRDYVVLLSDWSDDSPDTIVSNLKFQSDYYNFRSRTLGTFINDVSRKGLSETISDRLMWGEMRMSPTDILDVSGSTYTYLMNGQPPTSNWTALFRPGERVRLRFINGSSMSIFDVRIPDLPIGVVQSDGNDLVPVTVDEFRIGTAETYDVIVQPREARAYTIFAQVEDRTGFARGTLAPRPGMTAAIPPMDPRPMRSMKDMGMEHGSMGGMQMDHGSMPGMNHGATGGVQMDHGSMPGMNHGATGGMQMDHGSMPGMGHGPPGGMQMEHGSMPAARGSIGHEGMPGMPSMADQGAAAKLEGGVGVDNVAMMPSERLNEPGEGFPKGRRVLRYTDLRALKRGNDPRQPGREIVLHLTGNMDRFMWGFDGKKFSEAGPIELKRGERVRFTLINDTMMEHPMHLHGLWSELENGHGEYRPYKHTIIVKPGERLSFLVNADEPGRWAFHCHLLYHMESGMFREVHVA